jgi:hypothetical protein
VPPADRPPVGWDGPPAYSTSGYSSPTVAGRLSRGLAEPGFMMPAGCLNPAWVQYALVQRLVQAPFRVQTVHSGCIPYKPKKPGFLWPPFGAESTRAPEIRGSWPWIGSAMRITARLAWSPWHPIIPRVPWNACRRSRFLAISHCHYVKCHRSNLRLHQGVVETLARQRSCSRGRGAAPPFGLAVWFSKSCSGRV